MKLPRGAEHMRPQWVKTEKAPVEQNSSPSPRRSDIRALTECAPADQGTPLGIIAALRAPNVSAKPVRAQSRTNTGEAMSL